VSKTNAFPKVLKKREIKEIKKHPISSYVDIMNLLETLEDCQMKLQRARAKSKKLKEKINTLGKLDPRTKRSLVHGK